MNVFSYENATNQMLVLGGAKQMHSWCFFSIADLPIIQLNYT
jgi:hypothetical protein